MSDLNARSMISDDSEDDYQRLADGFIISNKGGVQWEDVVELDEPKEILKERVVLPLRFPQLFKGARSCHMGILMYGHPGSGKTYITSAVFSNISEVTYFKFSVYDLFSRWVKHGDRLLGHVFKMASEKRPSVISIDDVEVLCLTSDVEDTQRQKSKGELIKILMGRVDGVQVILNTSRPWLLDRVLLRHITHRAHITLPTETGRVRIIQNQLTSIQNTLSVDDIKALGGKTERSTPSDLVVLVRHAMFEPLRQMMASTHFKKTGEDGKYTPCHGDDPYAMEMTFMDIPETELLTPSVTMADFVTVLEKYKPTIDEQEVKQMTEFAQRYL
ncbi:vacuolar protein sorting-associated protein 4B [Patella vulgata]|uniref:vacuolar protein sorting-associated protein 4B n=1 Tax=Patella vulgata TaxID=6465 RepID=UPI0021808C45|nr:vacuolar protein sorting-associated protein 4B [Patella vulgata]